MRLWWHHFGRHFHTTAKVFPGSCKYCGAEGVVKRSDPVCAVHFSYTGKKLMASIDPSAKTTKVSSPQEGHGLLLAEEDAYYFTNLQRPAGCTAHIRSALDWPRFKARLLVDHHLPVPMLICDITPRHADLFASFRLTHSYGRMHFGGNEVRTINAIALSDAYRHLAPHYDAKRLRSLDSIRTHLTLRTNDKAYADARNKLREIHDQVPGSSELFPLRGLWPIEPKTATWEALMSTLRILSQPERAAPDAVPSPTPIQQPAEEALHAG